MNKSSRFVVAVQILSGLALCEITGKQGCLTSTKLAHSVNTNPVVIRRIMGVLRDAGLVTSLQGADGGSRLAKAAADISLMDIYRAVESGQLFHFHYSCPNMECPVGSAIGPIMERVLAKTEDAVQNVLMHINLLDIAQEMRETGKERWPSLA